MVWLLAFLLAGYALFLPVTLTVTIQHYGQTQTRLTLHFAGLHKTWTFRGSPGTMSPFRQSSNPFISALRKTDGARRFLLRHKQLVRLDVLLLLRTGDAARTAMLTGLFRGLLTALPRQRVRVCVQPDFFRPHSTANIRCIIRWKLGTILLTALMLLAETLHQRRLTESEAT